MFIKRHFNPNLFKACNSFATDVEMTHGLRKIMKEPTRTNKARYNLIDHVFVSYRISICINGVFNLHMSDHFAAYTQIYNFHDSIKRITQHIPPALHQRIKSFNQGNLQRLVINSMACNKQY